MKAPDFNKLADISKRLESASKQPGYSVTVFRKFADEAKEACGDKPEFMEFLGPFMPNEKPSKPPSRKRSLGTIGK